VRGSKDGPPVPGDKNRPRAIPCEGTPDDNFVYSFYNASGLPQDPQDPNSKGAMFLYGVPGGQLGVPFQPAIHWSPSQKCWTHNYAANNCSSFTPGE
jgi:hypothetical protein